MTGDEEPQEIYVLRMNSDVEVHTESSLVERLRELMYSGEIKPGWHVDRWYLTDYGWEFDPWET